MKKTIIILFLIIAGNSQFSQSNHKYNLWENPSFFRGYNILFEARHTYQDFVDFKNYGGNMLHIGVFGWMSEDEPYNIQQNNIDSTDKFVGYCRAAGIYYVLAVRSGPGAYDTHQETQGNTGESRIWNTGNTSEQQKYTDMLKIMVQRYAGDTLFVGINMVIEPRPKVKSIPANTSALYKYFLENVFHIHMDQVYSKFITGIRSVDPQLPIIAENFGYSTAELFPAYQLNDPYIIYSAHCYMPKEYTSTSQEHSLTYPGTYWNLTFLAQVYYDSTLMKNTIFSQVRGFQITTGSPILLGEFGVMYPQMGSAQYMSDILTITKDYGWHWAIWDWRRGSGKEWCIENFINENKSSYDDKTWITVLSYFHAPPTPNTIYPGSNTRLQPINPKNLTFIYDSLTLYTKYDVEVYDNSKNLVVSIYDYANSHWFYSGYSLQAGKSYLWRVRAKNPGGNPENWSAWSPYAQFFMSSDAMAQNSIRVYELKENYPNPFNPSTMISFSIPFNSNVTLKIYDLLGREVKELITGFKEAGSYSVQFDGNNIASGVYFYKLSAVSTDGKTSFISIKKMILTK